MNRFKDAEEDLQEALKISRILAKRNAPVELSGEADTLDELAALYFGMQRLGEAESFFQKALEIRRRLAKINPGTYKRDLADTLTSLGEFYQRATREGRPSSAPGGSANLYGPGKQ